MANKNNQKTNQNRKNNQNNTKTALTVSYNKKNITAYFSGNEEANFNAVIATLFQYSYEHSMGVMELLDNIIDFIDYLYFETDLPEEMNESCVWEGYPDLNDYDDEDQDEDEDSIADMIPADEMLVGIGYDEEAENVKVGHNVKNKDPEFMNEVMAFAVDDVAKAVGICPVNFAQCIVEMLKEMHKEECARKDKDCRKPNNNQNRNLN